MAGIASRTEANTNPVNIIRPPVTALLFGFIFFRSLLVLSYW